MKADYTLAIDPGLHGCGAAFGIANKIVRAGYIKGNPNTKEDSATLWLDMGLAIRGFALACSLTYLGASAIGDLIIELPQVYKASHQVGGKSKVDPDDIINLAGCVGTIIGTLHYPKTTIYRPYQWKGQVPKEICHARAIKALSTEELKVVDAGLPAKSLAHNVLDAVAIYLKHVGRVV
jgi:hypothetical protein